MMLTNDGAVEPQALLFNVGGVSDTLGHFPFSSYFTFADQQSCLAPNCNLIRLLGRPSKNYLSDFFPH